MGKIKVLVVDDSAVVRQSLESIINQDPQLQVIATASDPYVAVKRMEQEAPDVITLDIEMPRMDGLTFLKKIMSQHPLPVVICSSLTEENSATAIRALELGAVEIIQKPKLGVKDFLQEASMRICDAIKAAAQASQQKLKPAPALKVAEKLTADAVLAKAKAGSKAMIQSTDKVVVVGASTGGTEALREMIQALPADAPGMAVVQHMPEQFTRAFAQRLDQLAQVSVKEAANNDSLHAGRVLIAPGNSHLLLKRSGARYHVEVKDGPLVNRHRPSVDVLFRSAARYGGANVVAAILTGMGDDGARGMLELYEAGAYCIAQDQQSCVVFGMPQEAIKLGGVHRILPLHKIAQEILSKTKF